MVSCVSSILYFYSIESWGISHTISLQEGLGVTCDFGALVVVILINRRNCVTERLNADTVTVMATMMTYQLHNL